jgi:hypothetical protein
MVTEEELYRSCRIIFGSDLKITSDFLQYLQLSGIKKAYRQKALELHPDRGFSQSLDLQQIMSNRFIDVHQAYEKLLAYLENRDNGSIRGISAAAFSSQKESGDRIMRPGDRSTKVNEYNRKKSGDFKRGQAGTTYDSRPLDPKTLYHGPLPSCQLLFGRYLYYSGLINLQTIGQALVWQRTQRPCFGEIGRRMGWINERDTSRILRHRKDRNLFGELAMRL